MPVKPAQQVFPDSPKRQVRLPGIEGGVVVPEQVQIEALPIRRTVLDEQEPLEGDDDMVFIHEAVISHPGHLKRRHSGRAGPRG